MKDQPKKYKVLLIDDDPIMHILVKEALRRSGIDYTLKYINNSEEGLSHASSGASYDIAIIDRYFPCSISGPDINVVIKMKNPETFSILLSGIVSINERAEMAAFKFDKIFSKNCLFGCDNCTLSLEAFLRDFAGRD